jgi:hypothetical protein
MARPVGRCCICGVTTALSYEHVPPKSAFNSSRVFVANSKRLFGPEFYEQYFLPKGTYDQKGTGGYTICEKCNNNPGSWYVPSYVKWAHQGMRYLRDLPTGTNLSLPFKIKPLGVIKQIICMFASACGHGLLDSEPELRKFVLNRHFNYLSPAFRVYCCFMSLDSKASRQSGITGVLDGSGRSIKTHTFSEIAFPPFVYVLAIRSPPIDRSLQDISFFSDAAFAQYRQIHLQLGVREIASPFPGDFRTNKQIEDAYRRSGAIL